MFVVECEIKSLKKKRNVAAELIFVLIFFEVQVPEKPNLKFKKNGHEF